MSAIQTTRTISSEDATLALNHKLLEGGACETAQHKDSINLQLR